jgi:hypothetical protein
LRSGAWPKKTDRGQTAERPIFGTAKPQKGQARERLAIAGAALLRVAALYKVEDVSRGFDPDCRRAGRQELFLPLVDEFFARTCWPGQTRVAQIRSGRGYGL